MRNLDVNAPLRNLFGWERNPAGEIGLEIEIEGGPFPEGEAPAGWRVHHDHSLRGGGVEYVLRQPIRADRVENSLTALDRFLANVNKVFSYRTSVHVHVNIQQLTVRQWAAFIALFAILEEAVVDVIAPERAGNKFCLRFCDASYPIRFVADCIRSSRIQDMRAVDMKYASCNLTPLSTLGTLEFRAMRGNLDVGLLTDWVAFLVRLKEVASGIDDLRDFAARFSQAGPRMWLQETIGLPDNQIVRGLLALDGLEDKLYEGIRLAQDLCYCTDWTADVAPDPEPRVEVVLEDFEVMVAEPQQLNGWARGQVNVVQPPRRPRRNLFVNMDDQL